MPGPYIPDAESFDGESLDLSVRFARFVEAPVSFGGKVEQNLPNPLWLMNSKAMLPSSLCLPSSAPSFDCFMPDFLSFSFFNPVGLGTSEESTVTDKPIPLLRRFLTTASQAKSAMSS
eukprot:CAMPEP_0202369844 /NCGR_PEP_ID=MMETSP1127-20130417/1596_1 /ASSEMBLY_ACC=CAM_ASM_000462 /TAXON_ID=3047 /ORGANISM="Dunaliella tertiolecta, Strain CCMP1320" /LENGTH=117 /DNA_ID=CAMNT_0048965621 /DNA_START=191 /DNA_END=541 /DNA_ORIENTATION=-